MKRFKAIIQKSEMGAYVAVPEAVSRAFAGLARSGRIRVEGTVNGASLRATLIPVARRGHRLYVNGGMRAAAQVKVGDRVEIALKAVAPEAASAPDDVTAALQKARGALAAFNALTPSHRRELVRAIDDARTPSSRARRIEKTVDHVLGKTRPGGRPRTALVERPLWICPRCGNAFVNKNQYHSCKRYDVSVPFEGKPAFVRQIFERVREMVESFGPVTMLPYRNRVGFMVRVRFAGAIPGSRWLDLGFWLTRRIDDPRFHKIETFYSNAHVHYVRITKPAELDGQIRNWLMEAYRVGRQEHLVK